MPKLPYLDFKEVYPLAEIEDLARLLNLPLKGGATKRCVCPVHGGDERTLCVTPGVQSRASSTLGVFKCWASGDGGDRIGLVAHVMELGQQEAAHFIKEQFGTGETVATVSHRATVPDRDNVPANPRQARAPAPPQFDADKFASRLVWSEEVEKLGLSEEEAARLGVGFHPQQKQTYFPIRNPDGSISGFIGIKDSQAKLPPQWLAPSGNVVKLRRA